MKTESYLLQFNFLDRLKQLELPNFSDFRVPNIFIVLPGRGDEGDNLRGLGSSSNGTLPKITKPPALVLDTSAIIDGRIVDIVMTGFITGTLVVPSCVLRELRQIADSSNKLKRNRGRRGLEILQEIKKSPQVDFVIAECVPGEGEEIDVVILNFARDLGGKVITTDYNLNKVAKVSGVPILNVNELANMVKTVVLPGEEITVQVIQRGKEDGQGVGYFPDGTMVVVEGGADNVGEEVEVVVERLLQTAAGRMIFGKVVN